MDTSVTRRPQDGHWLFSSVFHESSSSNNYQQQVSTGPAARTDLSTRSLHKSTTIADQLRRFFTTARFQKRPDILPISEPEHETKTEYLNSQSGGTVLHIVQSHKLEGHEREAVLGKDTAQVPGKPDVKKPRYRDPLLDRTSKEYAGNNAIMYEESQHISEVGKGDDLSQLMLTNSGEYRRQSGAISVPVSSSTETNEALHNKARTEFVVNKWRQTFRKRRNERSRECSQHGAERRLVLRQRSVHTNRRKSSVEEHLHRKRQESSRYLKLGTIQSQPKRSGRQDTHRLRRGVGSRPKHRSRVRSNHRRRDAQREQSRYQRSPAGSKSDLYSSCSSDPKDVAIGRDHKENIPYTGLSKNRSRRYGVGSQEKLDSIQRGRRRNSSLARNASRDISVPQGQKKVQVVRPEADVEDPRPREPWPRKGQDNVPQDIRPALRTPTERFPEDPVPVRPRVASVERYRPGEIPKNARCTKIDRKLVNPEALELGRELFEERVGYVIVLRVLTRAEIEQYAIMTQQIRSRRAHADTDFRFGGNESTEDRSSEDSFKDDSYSSAKTPLDEAAKSIRKHDYSGIGSDKASGDNNSASVSSGLEGSGDEVDDSRADTMDDGNADFDIEKNHTHLPHNPSFHPKSPSSGQRSTSNAGTGEPKQRPDVTRRRFSVSRQRTLEHDEILTYDEEILFLHSENILKQLKNCTNQCKDTTTTIQLCFSAQPNLGHDAREICEATKECNTLLKAFLTIVEPLRDNKKIAEVVVADLGILLHGVRASLDIIERGFAHSDITLMDSGSRKTAWKHTIDSFEKKYLCSMLENLVLAHRFGTEVLSNLKLGILKSPESALLKKRLAQASGYKDLSSSPESPNLELYRIQNNYESAGDESNSSASSLTTWESNGTGEVSWFWISQTDVLPGYCATPWKSLFSDAVCVGAISIFLKTIEKFTNKSNFRYIASHDYCKEWLRLGRTTYPSYAHAANGGVVAAGVYEKTTIGAFESAIAPLELLRSYDFQVDRSYYPSARAVVENTAELMGLDSWLSICGRTSEIVDGSSHLLQNLPTLIQQIMMDVDLEFSSIDRASRDGGSRIIKTISGSLLQYLKEQQLSKAEQLFALVALLRTAKMALCIVRGTDTAQLHDVLVHDMQVYLA
ncbi:MAG: hypothetical protein LQ338_007642 [Usnochroma carphineum]|nr:MAG: hypothetical protein LQ338_007642 [Usnochroma carphineum]